MKRTVFLSLLAMLLVSTSFPVRAMDIAVDITGPDDLTALKPGIEKTVLARCISRGIPLEEYSSLNVSISTLGTIISFDALLDSTPPRAFHKDLEDQAGISPAIDEMIDVLFTGEIKEKKPRVPPSTGLTFSAIKLPFTGTSLVSLNGRLYASDRDAVYRLQGEKPEPVWKSPGHSTILRLYPHGETLLAVTELRNELTTYQILGTGEETWRGAVIPLGAGLLSTEPMYDPDIEQGSYTWTTAIPLEGSPLVLPKRLDPLSAVAGEIFPAIAGDEIVSFTRAGRLSIAQTDTTFWTSGNDLGIIPIYIEYTKRKRDESPVRYYLRPKILLRDGTITTFRNDQGMAELFRHTTVFTKAEILSYRCADADCDQTVLLSVDNAYCADLTLHEGTLLALIVKKRSCSVIPVND
ncbi:MAG: hypothetical protein ACP5G0_08175 [Desulfomonilia bacterium]